MAQVVEHPCLLVQIGEGVPHVRPPEDPGPGAIRLDDLDLRQDLLLLWRFVLGLPFLLLPELRLGSAARDLGHHQRRLVPRT